MADCLFCKIVNGEIPCDKVDETGEVLAFRDIDPQAPTHVLLIPKEHMVDSAAHLHHEHATMLAELFGLAASIARQEKLGDGWRVVTNVGPHAGQTVHHLHFHL